MKRMVYFKRTRLASITYQISGGIICAIIGWVSKDILDIFSYGFYVVSAWLLWGGLSEVINPLGVLNQDDEEKQYYDQLTQKMDQKIKDDSGT